MFEKDLLEGKTALVIGGSSESGPSVCNVLARYGAGIALTYLKNRSAAQQVARECRSRGVRSEIYQFDFLELEQVLNLIPQVAEEFGGLDILINLGGPPPVYSDFRDLSANSFDLMVDGHFKGPFFLAREAGSFMERNGGGRVVNISATSSIKYSHSAYGLAKACVNEMTRFLAHTYAPKVRFINIIPGMIDIKETDPKNRKQRADNSPLRRIVSPEELGLLVVASASPAFQSITGESIIADAGFWLLHQ
jgi:NAD(P)-dependent dehydrogenase (short-subunit alcohol dehydrogenase family)